MQSNWAEELRHLRTGPEPGESQGGSGLVTVGFDAPGGARLVVDRLRELLTTAVGLEASAFEDPVTSAQRLPAWFLEACAPDRSEAEREAWLSWWRDLSPAERVAAEAAERWTASNWLSWLEPEDRPWLFWDAAATDEDAGTVEVQVAGWPTPLGALEWALRAAGSDEVRLP